MRKIISVFFMVIFILNIPTFCFAQDKWEALLIESARVFEEMMEMPDEGIPQDLLRDCRAIIILPSTIGGGFIIGGKYGQGVVLAKDKRMRRWSAPAVFTLAGGSFGWQIGGQATDTILLVMSERGLDGILQSKCKLGGDASIAAGPIGREAEASTDLQLKGGILSYSRSRGAFIGLKLEGAVLSFNEKANSSLYNKSLSSRDILIKMNVKPPKHAGRLMKDLRRFR